MDYKMERPRCPECGSEDLKKIRVFPEETKIRLIKKYLYSMVKKIEEKETTQIIEFSCKNCGKKFREKKIY